MRSRVPCDDRHLARPRHDVAHAAQPVSGQDRFRPVVLRSDGDLERPRDARARAPVRSERDRRAEAALHPALGDEPLCRADEGRLRQRAHRRSGARRDQAAARAGAHPDHGLRARAQSGHRLQACRHVGQDSPERLSGGPHGHPQEHPARRRGRHRRTVAAAARAVVRAVDDR